MLSLFNCLVHLVISLLKIPSHGLMRHYKINGSHHAGTFESAFRVSNHLCRFYRDSFVAALEKQGMAIATPMSTVQYVAMLNALKVTGTKERVLLRYLQQYVGKEFCPTQRGVSILAEGHTNLHTGSIQWMYEGKGLMWPSG